MPVCFEARQSNADWGLDDRRSDGRDRPARGAFSILPCSRDAARFVYHRRAAETPQLHRLARVGWELKAKAGKKPVILELGGNAACIVDEDADLEDAAERMIVGAFYQSGQSCIGVQRILIHENVYDQSATCSSSARRISKWATPRMRTRLSARSFLKATASGSKTGSSRRSRRAAKSSAAVVAKGRWVEATLLENVPDDQPICAEEAFGPVAVLAKFSDFDAALAEVNDSVFGLQAGIFTRDIYKMLSRPGMNWKWAASSSATSRASWRVDNMPYGGVKDSGLGREGIRYAIEDMTELRLLVIREGKG